MSAKFLFALAVITLLISLPFRVWTDPYNNPVYGFEAFLFGWLALITFDPRWFCNAIIIIALKCVFKKHTNFASGTCFILAAAGTTVIFGPYHAGFRGGVFNLFEGSGLYWGGYLWIVSLWLFAISTYVRKTEIDSNKYP